MREQPIYLERRGEIAVMVFNRPAKRNALNLAIWSAIPDLAREIAADKGIKVAILRGATEAAFAAGADIGEFAEVHATADRARHYHGTIARAYDAIASLAKPTIAMIQGVCYGGGCALALCCDLRYADHSARFSIPPARLGLAYSLRETKRLVDLVGPAKAKEMLMGARVIGAEEALAAGLATRLFVNAELETETIAFAEQLCALSQYSIGAIKEIVGLIVEGATEDNARSRELVFGAFDDSDYHEGRAAFLEKREPNFGRS